MNSDLSELFDNKSLSKTESRSRKKSTTAFLRAKAKLDRPGKIFERPLRQGKTNKLY